MHLPLSQWKSTGEQVGSTANKKHRSAGTKKQVNKLWDGEKFASITLPAKNIYIFLF